MAGWKIHHFDGMKTRKTGDFHGRLLLVSGRVDDSDSPLLVGGWTTHLKNMLVKLGSSSPIFGVKIKHVWNHHLVLECNTSRVSGFWPNGKIIFHLHRSISLKFTGSHFPKSMNPPFGGNRSWKIGRGITSPGFIIPRFQANFEGWEFIIGLFGGGVPRGGGSLIFPKVNPNLPKRNP